MQRNEENSGKYDDIIRLPHPEPKHHPRMSMHDRAAQFAPFAALSGHGGRFGEAAGAPDGHGPSGSKMQEDCAYGLQGEEIEKF